LNFITKTFNFGVDLATSLENREEYDINHHHPSLKTSQVKDDEIIEVLNEQYKID
jgi:hypothetical protein